MKQKRPVSRWLNSLNMTGTQHLATKGCATAVLRPELSSGTFSIVLNLKYPSVKSFKQQHFGQTCITKKKKVLTVEKFSIDWNSSIVWVTGKTLKKKSDILLFLNRICPFHRLISFLFLNASKHCGSDPKNDFDVVACCCCCAVLTNFYDSKID